MGKSNWGKGIFAAIAIFMVVWAVLIYFAFSQKVDLVVPNYYEKELTYQQQIEKERNTELLGTKPKIEIVGQIVNISFPADEAGHLEGGVWFYRSADSQYDRHYPLVVDSSETVKINAAAFQRGYWRVKIEWKVRSIPYALEETIFLE